MAEKSVVKNFLFFYFLILSPFNASFAARLIGNGVVEKKHHRLTLDNTEWLVAVFHVPKQNSPVEKLVYEFLCPGVLIHPQAVVVSSLCWTKQSESLDLVVRSYNWTLDKITEDTPYVEESVQEILNNVNYDDSIVPAGRVNVLVLSNAFHTGHRYGTNHIPFKNYAKIKQLHRDECVGFDIAGNITHGLTMRKFLNYPTNILNCCAYWHPALQTAADLAAEMNNCMVKLESLDCSEQFECNKLAASGSPIFCATEEPLKHGLTFHGFVADAKRCRYLLTKIQPSVPWIREILYD